MEHTTLLNEDFDVLLDDDLTDMVSLDDIDLSATPNPPAPFQPKSTSPWDARFVLDLAIGVDSLPEILERYGISERVYERLTETPSFRRELAMAIRDVRENGLSFTHKAKVQAETYLGVLDDMIYDETTPANTRLEAIKSTVRWGGLEQRDDKNDQPTGPPIQIQINF